MYGKTMTEITDISDLEVGDRVTVIKDSDIEIEDTGTDYKIPDSEVKEDVVVIDNALIDRIGEGGLGGLLQVDLVECDKSQQARGDSIPEYIDEDSITVIKHEDPKDEADDSAESDDEDDNSVDEHTVEMEDGEAVTLKVGDEFENTNDGRTAIIKKIRQEPLDDSYAADYDTQIELSNGETTADYTLAAALDKGNIVRL